MVKINWEFCQNNSDKIVAGGLYFLKTSPIIQPKDIPEDKQGNYLFSNAGQDYYIGEAKDLRKRVKQQLSRQTSTFYKTYSLTYSNAGSPIEIRDFDLKILFNRVGRKEIEEAGIVSFNTPLNKFEKGKRNKICIESCTVLWNEIQDNRMNIFLQGEELFFSKGAVRWDKACPCTAPGLYAVKDNCGRLLYIGESTNIKERYKAHCSSTYFSALRRHIGTELLGLDFCDTKKRRFTREDDFKVNAFLSYCNYFFLPVNYGRFELEEHLIRKNKPQLNLKDNVIERT